MTTFDKDGRIQVGFRPPTNPDGTVIPAGTYYMGQWRKAQDRVEALEAAIRKHLADQAETGECRDATLRDALKVS